MEFYDIECKGRLVLEKLSELPTYNKERDEGRLVYNESDHLIYYGKDDAWDLITDLGEIDQSLENHINNTSAHSSTSNATANRIILRDSNGRARVAAPSHDSDIARKLDVDNVGSVAESNNININNHISSNAPSVHGITAAWIRQQVYPIGFVYIQFPGESTPSSLFGGSWSRIFNTEAIYFRTEGTGALSFGAGIQGDAMRNLTGKIRVLSGSTRAIFREDGVTGVFDHASAIITGNVRTDSSSYKGSTMIDIDASRQVPTASEFRVKNRTIRIWKKTSH